MPFELQKSTPKKKVKIEKTQNSIFDFLKKDFSLFKTGMKDKKKEEFYSELSMLLSSGIDIKTSLEIIVDEQIKKSDKQLFEVIYKKVINGNTLSEALKDSGKFTNYEYFSIKIGEESGRVKEVLKDLTIYYNKKIKQKRQMTSAFSYPLFVLGTAFGVIFFMLKFIVPMFSDVFKRFGGELPGITQFIISASDALSKNIGFIFFIILLIFAAIYFSRQKIWYKRVVSKLILNMPIFGDVFKKIYLCRFCQSMALLISSKTPMLRAIQLVKNMIDFYPYEKALTIIEQDIMNGKLLNQSMQAFDIFDKRTISLVKIAEEVNQLDKIFTTLNDQYTEELEYKIGVIGNLLEPILIIFVGAIVAVVLISMYLPMFSISSSIM